jgi:sulfonate transport system substrate-binding protein
MKRVNKGQKPVPSFEFITFQTLPAINESFASKQLDFVFEAEPPAIIGAAAGIPLRITQVGCSLRQEIIVPANSSIQSIKDLKGHKIAVLAGTSSHFGLLADLAAVSVAKGEFQILDLTPPDAKAAFESGRAWQLMPRGHHPLQVGII